MGHELLYLSRADVQAVGLEMPRLIELLEVAFREKGAGRVSMPPKPSVYPAPDSFLHAMPAHIPALRSLGIKWVSAYPTNPLLGLPYVAGLIVLNDDATGLPYAVMDCTWITAHRTAAASALAAKYLARPESSVLGVLGCGVQARTHLLALAALFPIERVYAYDIVTAASERYAAEMRELSNLAVVCVDDPKSAVIHSDIIVTCGPIHKHPEPSIERGWLAPGAFASAVDFDSRWQPAAMAEFDKFVTDDLAQFEYYRREGYFQRAPTPHADLGHLVAGSARGRERPTERTMAMNLGLALDDMAVAPEIYRRAEGRGVGTRLPL